MRLPPMPTISEIVKLYGLSARQSLSQNFILDQNLLGRVVRSCGVLEGATVLEVGAGPGNLTRALLQAGARHVIALEKDERFVPALKMLQEAAGGAEKMSVVLGDALLVDEAQLLRQAQARTGEVHVVGNLPFAVSTELLLKWVRQVPRGSGLSEFGPVPMTLLFQKEVGERLCAQPGQKEFGRLSVMTQHVCAVRRGFEIRGSAFVPKPDVDSLVITVTPKTRFEPVRQETLELVLRQVCGQRRKMMRNATLSLTPDAAQLLAASELDDTMRPEQLTVAQWCRLANEFDKMRGKV